jgi:hypothetical protein
MTDTGPLGVHTPRPFQPASGLSMSPSRPFALGRTIPLSDSLEGKFCRSFLPTAAHPRLSVACSG